MLDEGPIVLDQRSACREIVLGRRGSGGGSVEESGGVWAGLLGVLGGSGRASFQPKGEISSFEYCIG